MSRGRAAGAMMELVLHGYWRSSAAYRVRIALALKGLRYRQICHDLRTGDQRSADYLALAPHGLVPALDTGTAVLIESPAILEWLEAVYPSPALLPRDPREAAVVRAMGAIVACDIHPINNLRVLAALRQNFGADEAQISAWIARWVDAGFAAIESMIARHGGRFAYGDSPTHADCYLMPQVFNAQRFGVDLSAYPRICGATDALCALPAVAAAHPARQPDAHIEASPAPE